MSDEELREICLNLLSNAWPAYLTTIDKDGFPQTRAMFNLRNQNRFPKLVPLFQEHEDDFFIIFSTNTSSTKTADVKGNSKAATYYCDPENSRGTMFGGTVEIVPDLELKKAIWHDGWEFYYPKGYDDPDHTILQMKPIVARGWNQSHTFRLDLGEGK
jgi:general stress protein 26